MYFFGIRTNKNSMKFANQSVTLSKCVQSKSAPTMVFIFWKKEKILHNGSDFDSGFISVSLSPIITKTVIVVAPFTAIMPNCKVAQMWRTSEKFLGNVQALKFSGLFIASSGVIKSSFVRWNSGAFKGATKGRTLKRARNFVRPLPEYK